MAKLQKVWVESVSDGDRLRHELRLDWDNGYHQAVSMDSLSTIDVELALTKIAVMLRRERMRDSLNERMRDSLNERMRDSLNERMRDSLNESLTGTDAGRLSTSCSQRAPL